MKKYKIGDIVKGKITGVVSYGIFIRIDSNICGLVHISEISDDFVQNIFNYYKKGMIISVKIVDISDSNKYNLSIKQIDFSKRKDVSKIPEMGSGFNMLKNNLQRWVDLGYNKLNLNKKHFKYWKK